MGSSFVEYKGKGFWVYDPGLQVWLETLVQAIDRWSSPPEWLALARQDWHRQALGTQPAFMNPELDEFASTEEQKGVLITLSRQALAQLATNEPVVSHDLLNGMLRDEAIVPWEHRGFFTRDVPLAGFLIIGNTFIQLLRGELTTTASTSPTLGVDHPGGKEISP